MTCPSQTYAGGEADNTAFQNWSGRFSGPVNSLFTPNSLEELVNRIQLASSQGHKVHVVGSGWAFEDGAYSPDWMISLDRLNQPITAVTDTAINNAWKARQAGGFGALFHIQAGAKIYEANAALDAKGLGFGTLGGNNGQGLAGAISTSTHGGDLQHGPLAEMVKAMHLVTMNGREIWIERASDPITDDISLAQALTCPDTEILRNDDVFNALLVGFGRFGVIYSYMLLVQPAFRLAEWTTKIPRATLTAKLREGLAANTFLTPLLSMLPNPPFGGVNIAVPRGLEVVFDTNNLGECYVKRRWVTTDPTDLNVSNDLNPACVIGAFGVLNAALAVLSPFAAIPFYGVAVSVGMGTLSAEYTANPTMSSGDMLAKVLAMFWSLGLGGSIPAISGVEFGSQYQNSTGAGKIGKSHVIMTGAPYNQVESCFRADSIEPIFDAHSTQYIDFLDLVLNNAPNFQQAGYISLRWSLGLKATMSMHNVNLSAVAIEVTSLKGLPQNNTWMSTLHALAVGHSGRPHWGQVNQLNTTTVATLYGPLLQNWTSTLGALVGQASIFSNNYTVQRGLEPPAAAVNPTIFGARAQDVLLAGFLPAINLLLSPDEVKLPVIPKPPLHPIKH